MVAHPRKDGVAPNSVPLSFLNSSPSEFPSQRGCPNFASRCSGCAADKSTYPQYLRTYPKVLTYLLEAQ
eukprot:9502229-Pyramimonas_sp.AAC.1